VFKSKYTMDLSAEKDFFSYMSEDFESVADKEAVICGRSGRSLTYQQLFDQAKQIGVSLQRRGYRHGDVAAIFAPNIPEYTVTVLGCAYAGLTVTVVNPLYQVSEVANQLRETNVVVFFAFASFAKSAVMAKDSVPRVREIFIYGLPLKFTKMNSVIDKYVKLFHSEVSCYMFDELLTPPRKGKRSDTQRPWFVDKVDFQPSKDILLIPYSSGTTGVPKGACHTHSTLIAYIEQLLTFPDIKRYEGSSFIVVLPMFHIFGFILPFAFTKMKGTSVTNPLFQKTMFLDSIHRYKLNVLPVVPALVNFMATDPDAYTKRKYDLSSVKALYSGGAPLSNELGQKFQKKYPNIRLCQGYGMTEGFIASPEEDDQTPYESVGKLLANNELRVIDSKTREECDRNQPGELMVKTPSAFHGYLNNPEATAESFHFDEDGQKWLLTGDIGYIDDNDNIFLVDRLKELLKYKGHQVSPVEVENCLTDLKGVKNAAVAGIPHEVFGDVPMAFVALEEGSTLTEDEIHEHVNSRLAFQNHLRGGVVFIDEIPVSRIGKILRGEVRKLVKEKIASGEIKLLN